MGPGTIVADTPRFNHLPRLLQRTQPLLIQAFRSKTSVKALDLSVLCRLARLNEDQLDLVLIRPQIKSFTPEFRAVIHLDLVGQPLLGNGSIQQAHHSFSTQTRIYLLAQALPGKSVCQIHGAKAPAIGHSVVDEIHRPPLTWLGCHCNYPSFLALQALFAFLFQNQLFFLIQAMRLFVVATPTVKAQSAVQQAIAPRRFDLG
jgi:hypothetical protein